MAGVVDHPHAPRRATPIGRANPSSMDDRRVTWLRAQAKARPSEEARLDAEADATLAARAAGVSRWAELPPLVLQQVLELLQWEPTVCSAMRLVCSSWGSILDALLPRTLTPRHSLAVMTMEGKLGWFESVTMVILVDCGESASAVLAELRSMPSLCGLWLPASCAERAVDAEAVYGLTTLTTLGFRGEISEAGTSRGGGGRVGAGLEQADDAHPPVSAAQLCFFQTGLGALGRLRTLPHTGVLAGARH